MNQMNLEHPDITRCLLTGFPNLDVIDPENDEWDEWEDEIFEEARERKAGMIDQYA